MKYYIPLSVIIALLLFNILLTVSTDESTNEKVVTVDKVQIPSTIEKNNIHKNDSVRIKQYHEVCYLLEDKWFVKTELWCTYRNKLYLEKAESCIVSRSKIDSAKIAQFNWVHPYYDKLRDKVKNKLINL